MTTKERIDKLLVERGLADIKAGRVVDGDAMERWLGSWGTDDELEPPA